MFTPAYTITPAITRALMDIEGARQVVTELPITARLLKSLRESARLGATHYSTQIEGNRLTKAQVAKVLHGGTFPNRERDEHEVKQYYLALDYLDELIATAGVIREVDVQTLHGLVMGGKRKPSPYRDGQNAIYNSSDGSLVYLPPEAPDVSDLMTALIDWINTTIADGELPPPLVAGIAHYQFATIHPYFDGNGRVARLLTNLVLHRCGYGLRGIYSLEEYYAQDLQHYYRAISVGESHNYYFGRSESDISGWLAYFCKGMADAFHAVRSQAEKGADAGAVDQSVLLRELDLRQRQVLSLFETRRYVTTKEIAELLGIHQRTALHLCRQWIESNFLLVHGGTTKKRRYELADPWSSLIG